jgi:hypothetical protein
MRIGLATCVRQGLVFDFHPQLTIAVVEFLYKYLARFGHANCPDHFASLPNNTRRSISIATGRH